MAQLALVELRVEQRVGEKQIVSGAVLVVVHHRLGAFGRKFSEETALRRERRQHDVQKVRAPAHHAAGGFGPQAIGLAFQAQILLAARHFEGAANAFAERRALNGQRLAIARVVLQVVEPGERSD